MIRVHIEVRNDASYSRVIAQARNLREAARIASAAYPNATDVRVKFPIDPEAFFVKEPTARAGIAGFEREGGIAAA
jgi:hypothetical protein